MVLCKLKQELYNIGAGGFLMLANTIKNIIDDYKAEGKSLTQNDLARVLGMTKQSFSNKMQRDTFTVEDMIKISEFLDMKIVLKGENEYIIK